MSIEKNVTFTLDGIDFYPVEEIGRETDGVRRIFFNEGAFTFLDDDSEDRMTQGLLDARCYRKAEDGSISRVRYASLSEDETYIFALPIKSSYSGRRENIQKAETILSNQRKLS